MEAASLTRAEYDEIVAAVNRWRTLAGELRTIFADYRSGNEQAFVGASAAVRDAERVLGLLQEARSRVRDAVPPPPPDPAT